MARHTPFLLTLFGVLTVSAPVLADPAPDLKALREKVLKADDENAKVNAYRALFTAVGRAGLEDLTKDEDAGIALQAAWEANLKPAKRAQPVDHRTDDVYDPAELKKF